MSKHPAGSSNRLEEWPLERLHPHGENRLIFGDPEESPFYEAMLASVRKLGILEPLAVREDGVVLAGHLRLACAKAVGLATVPVRILAAFADHYDEVVFLVRSNTDRRQLTKAEVGLAFKRLRELPREKGGTGRKRGRPKAPRDEPKPASANRGTVPRIIDGARQRGRDDAAATLGVSEKHARACETIFTTEGVPAEVRAAVNKGSLGAIPAAKAIRAEKVRQGGTLQDPQSLLVLIPGTKATAEDRKRYAEVHERLFASVYSDLIALHRRLDTAVTRLPLASVTNPDRHHKLRGVLHDIAVRAWREIERIEGPTQTGKQLHLTLIQGGAS